MKRYRWIIDNMKISLVLWLILLAGYGVYKILIRE